VITGNPKSQKHYCSCVPPPRTTEAPGKRHGIERFFDRVFLFFVSNSFLSPGGQLLFPRVAFTSTASLLVALAAWNAGVLMSFVLPHVFLLISERDLRYKMPTTIPEPGSQSPTVASDWLPILSYHGAFFCPGDEAGKDAAIAT